MRSKKKAPVVHYEIEKRGKLSPTIEQRTKLNDVLNILINWLSSRKVFGIDPLRVLVREPGGYPGPAPFGAWKEKHFELSPLKGRPFFSLIHTEKKGGCFFFKSIQPSRIVII